MRTTWQLSQIGIAMKFMLLGIAAMVSTLASTHATAADGKEVYNKSCALCHNSLPPKLGDKAAWEPRMKQGTDALVAAVVKGEGSMPPKGGNASLSEADIRASVEYMVGAVK